VVTDSACSLPAELAQAAGARVVPMWVHLGSEEHPDGALPTEEVLRRSPEGVTTSCPSPGQLLDACEQADDGDGVLVLTISARMSGVYEAAVNAARQRAGRTEVVDTGTAAGAEGLVVLAACAAARQGRSLDEVSELARSVARRARLVATVPSLDHLARSGRVPAIAASGARRLGLGALFEFRHGRAFPLRPALGRQAALERMLAMLARDADRSGDGPGRLHVAGLHALDRATAEQLVERVRLRWRPETSFVGDFSAVMVAHTGPGLVGLAWYWDRA
jgi:DegV family protein with EDD domain